MYQFISKTHQTELARNIEAVIVLSLSQFKYNFTQINETLCV